MGKFTIYQKQLLRENAKKIIAIVLSVIVLASVIVMIAKNKKDDTANHEITSPSEEKTVTESVTNAERNENVSSDERVVNEAFQEADDRFRNNDKAGAVSVIRNYLSENPDDQEAREKLGNYSDSYFSEVMVSSGTAISEQDYDRAVMIFDEASELLTDDDYLNIIRQKKDEVLQMKETQEAASDRQITGTVITKVDDLNVRTGPGTSYQKVGTVPKGGTVIILGEESGWYIIDYYGERRYVSQEFIRIDN